MTEDIKKKIVEAYQTTKSPIVEIARQFNVSVEEVLVATGNSDLVAGTPVVGDLVDESEAGPEATISRGKVVKQKYTKD